MIKHKFASAVRSVLRKTGYDVVRYEPAAPAAGFPEDFDAATIAIVQAVQPYTRTSRERIFALCEAVKYVVAHDIPGAIVECGVWRGGSMMAAAHTLVHLGAARRELYLYDTFDGMTAPNEQDVAFTGVSAAAMLESSQKDDAYSVWCFSALEEVQRAMESTGYDPAHIHLIQGKVEDTLPERAPDRIALLRLDTDWYESTYHELVHLFPRLAPGGVIIIDDYGHWQGARKAVDQYLYEHQIRLLLNRIDYTGRIGVVG